MKYKTICENHLFSKVYSSGAKCASGTIVLYVLTDKHASFFRRANPRKEKINRIGITVSKKIGGAVERNRAKRIIREAYRQLECEYELKKGKLVVIAARGNIEGAKMPQVKKDLERAMRRLELLG